MRQLLIGFESFLREGKKLSESTIKCYHRDLVMFGQFLESRGISDFLSVTALDLEGYLLFLKENNKATSTASRHLASIKTFYGFLQNNGYILTNPTSGLKTPKSQKSEPLVLTLNEVESILLQPDLRTAIGKRDKAMIELLYATGIRVSELVNLNLSHLFVSNGYVVCGEKTKERAVPLGVMAAQALSTYLDGARPQLSDSEEKALFVNYSGKRMTRQGFWKIIKRYSYEAGINKPITPHTIRHSFALHLVQNGANLKAVQEMMGHSDVTTTQRYLEMTSSKIKDIYEKAHPRA